MIDHFTQALPLVALIAAACAFLGWSMHGVVSKPAPAKSAKAAPASDKNQPDRAKNLEATLEKSKAAHKALKGEFEVLQANTVSKETFESATAELAAARTEQEAVGRRLAALETDLKKSQDTIRTLNARTNEGDKAQKSRTFSLENELSKAREQLALLQNRPDDSSALQIEIERLRDSVATTTRFAGEVRKREAAALEALEKAEARVAELADGSRNADRPKKIGPVGDSGRIAAAKAEVLRLLEQNKLRDAAEATPAPTPVAEPIVSEPEPPAPAEPETFAQVEETVEPVIPEFVESETPVAAEPEAEVLAEAENPTPDTSETLAQTDESPASAEDLPHFPDYESPQPNDGERPALG